jgi:5-methylcytosine-specific restriction enzyme subunit McrC
MVAESSSRILIFATSFNGARGYRDKLQITTEGCVGRSYNRLNADYEPMHALCRFFLENSGPTHERGDRSMLPFLVNMPRLYELFVSEWLKAHLPDAVSLVPQERAHLDGTSGLYFDINLVLRDTSTGKVLGVMDTKYKNTTTPATNDVAQIVAYAEKMGCQEALLVYARGLPQPFEGTGGRHPGAVSALLPRRVRGRSRSSVHAHGIG